MADWYVYQHDGDPLGPWSTDTVSEAILAGKLAPDVWVAAPGGPRWLRALDVPVIAALVDGLPTKPRRRESGLRLMPGAFSTENGMPMFAATMMIVKDHEIEIIDDDESPTNAPVTTRNGAPAAEETLRMQVSARALEAIAAGFASDEEPPTDPSLPPSVTSPTPPAARVERVDRVEKEAVDLPSSDRRRRRKNA